MGTRRGQAFVELALGMLALALVLSTAFNFTLYILRSLEMQRTLRAEAGHQALAAGGGAGAYSSAAERDVVDVEPFAADFIFGSTSVPVEESVHIPNMKGEVR